MWASTFPITVNTDVMIPDQAAMIKQYKGRLKKMQAAQRDSHGGYRIDVDAQVAQRQLIETLENLISSSLKTCRTSIVIGVRTSQPVQSHRDLAEQERVLVRSAPEGSLHGHANERKPGTARGSSQAAAVHRGPSGDD